ncbi:MAG: hypothetical protein OYH77_06385 [Pseudomonadota bacterium]|nr:hypothetical protein [Pseudomonadota bacterium]
MAWGDKRKLANPNPDNAPNIFLVRITTLYYARQHETLEYTFKATPEALEMLERMQQIQDNQQQLKAKYLPADKSQMQ